MKAQVNPKSTSNQSSKPCTVLGGKPLPCPQQHHSVQNWLALSSFPNQESPHPMIAMPLAVIVQADLVHLTLVHVLSVLAVFLLTKTSFSLSVYWHCPRRCMHAQSVCS